MNVRRTVTLGLVIALMSARGVMAAEPGSEITTQTLPPTLTLTEALRRVDAQHPVLLSKSAQEQGAQARLDRVRARSGFQADINLTLSAVDLINNGDAGDGFVNDSYGRLVVRKRLYDFGRSRAKEDAASQSLAARQIDLMNAPELLQIEIMRAFFNVVLADMRYATDNEDMAYKYVRFDKVRERQQLGMVSDVDVLELESIYQDSYMRRNRSQLQQSSARSRLAILLNRPGELPHRVVRPRLDVERHALPDYKTALDKILITNPRLRALALDVKAAKAKVNAMQADWRPILEAEVSSSAYEREVGSRNSAEALLRLRMPLYQGGGVKAALKEAISELHIAEAEYRKLELDLHQSALDLVQTLEALKIERHAARVRLDYRDMKLDQNRALYEMEVQTTLGDSMVLVTDAFWQAARAEFETLVTWTKLNALQGKGIDLNEWKAGP